MKNPTEKDRAIALRREGYSYNYIVKKTNVSKSTLHYWLADIPYTPNKETIARIGRARAKSGEVKSKMKRDSIRKAGEIAKNDIKEINKRDLFMLGLGLYIGEGSKTADHIRVINSDPRIICLAVGWFEEICGLTKSNLSLAIHLYPDNNIRESIAYWRDVTGIPREQFGKTQIDKRDGKKMAKRGKLPYGTAHLSVRSCGNKNFGVFLARKIKGWMEEVLKKTDSRRD
ncbi:MAG: hypothetical protein NUV65_06995 [Candidatus Roizmanbacteria bacterium]|nr:hypothetical protein [Candidatus Roizmanbacteria bacterium]